MIDLYAIYITDEGQVALVTPTEEALSKNTHKEIFDRDIPEGKPYRIIDESEMPSDLTWLASWTVDESYLVSGVGTQK